MSDDFENLGKLLSESVLASYLLAYDQTTEENLAKIKTLNLSESKHIFTEKQHKIRKSHISKNPINLNDPIELSFDVPPSEAIDYFKHKQILTKKEFDKLERKAKSAAFFVAGIYEEDILKAFHDEILSALESGKSQKVVINNFKKILTDGGHKMLGDYHLENIFRTNMQMAYGVGRRTSMEEVTDYLPIWEYSAVGDNRTRPRHLALDGIQYPASHRFWSDYYPPWEFSCRCVVSAVGEYRKGYNHEQPNPDTRITYNDDGLPAKAEYETQVVDMKIGKFVGVPKITDLEQVLKTAAQASKDLRAKK